MVHFLLVLRSMKMEAGKERHRCRKFMETRKGLRAWSAVRETALEAEAAHDTISSAGVNEPG